MNRTEEEKAASQVKKRAKKASDITQSNGGDQMAERPVANGKRAPTKK